MMTQSIRAKCLALVAMVASTCAEPTLSISTIPGHTIPWREKPGRRGCQILPNITELFATSGLSRLFFYSEFSFS